MSEDTDGLKIDVLTLGNRLNRIDRQLKDGEIIVTHKSDRYRLKIERAASTKGVDGFVVDVSGDDFDVVQRQAEALYDYAKALTTPVNSASIENKQEGR